MREKDLTLIINYQMFGLKNFLQKCWPIYIIIWCIWNIRAIMNIVSFLGQPLLMNLYSLFPRNNWGEQKKLVLVQYLGTNSLDSSKPFQKGQTFFKRLVAFAIKWMKIEGWTTIYGLSMTSLLGVSLEKTPTGVTL